MWVSLTPVPVLGISSAAAVSVHNAKHSCAQLTDETLKCWGNNDFGSVGNGSQGPAQPEAVTVVGVSGAVGLSTRWLGGCARNGFGQIGDATTTDRLTAVPAQ